MRFALVPAVCALVGALASASDALAQTPPLNCTPWGKPSMRGTMCTLAHDDTVKGNRLPAGTMIHHDSTNTLNFFWLVKPARVRDLDLAGGSDGPHHNIWPDGTIRITYLSHPQTIQGVPCRSFRVLREIFGHTSRVSFHRNGRLAACRTDQAVTVQGKRFSGGDLVQLDSLGQLLARP